MNLYSFIRLQMAMVELVELANKKVELSNQQVAMREQYKQLGEELQTYGEEERLAILMSGNYKDNLYKEKINFYHLKGVMEELLDSLGYNGRYSIVVDKLPNELTSSDKSRFYLPIYRKYLILKNYEMEIEDGNKCLVEEF